MSAVYLGTSIFVAWATGFVIGYRWGERRAWTRAFAMLPKDTTHGE